MNPVNQSPEFNPHKIYQQLVGLGTQWAELDGAASLYEENKKSLLAQLAATSNENSMAAKENYALRHTDYVKHIGLMVEARKEANKARAKYDSAKVFVELLRTQEANARAANKFST